MSGQIVKQRDVFRALYEAGLISPQTTTVTIAGHQFNGALEPWDGKLKDEMDYVDIAKEGEGCVWLRWSNNDDGDPYEPVDGPKKVTAPEIVRSLAEKKYAPRRHDMGGPYPGSFGPFDCAGCDDTEDKDDPADHDPTCFWRQAVEWVKDNPPTP